uniref:Uncharacterized protein n=1 Tax=Odontella aurita TaxID=265563 RepID=A0A7S4N7M3_9STRA|mmetsp:Transcript_51093/g.153543  ORF Transcript_51093/g.153543 Transcript_51093/m.153543 type:complete len:249 (+) Transcript_51093:71-817(+)
MTTAIAAADAAAAAERAAAAELQTSLLTYTKASNRKQVLKSLKDATFLSNIALDASAFDDADASEREVASDRVVLNGLHFHGSADSPSTFLDTLREVSRQLCERGEGAAGPEDPADDDDDDRADPRDVYEGLIFRMTRSVNAADSYFKLNALLGSPDLILMPRKEAHSDLPPVEVDLMAVDGTVQATISCPNVYGLFRKGDLKNTFGKAQPMPYEAGINPWISIDAIVEQRVNFTNGESVRYLRIKTA